MVNYIIKAIYLSVIIGFTSQVYAKIAFERISAERKPDEHYLSALNRHMPISTNHKRSNSGSALQVRAAFDQLDFSVVEDWTYPELISAFRSGRDSRVLKRSDQQIKSRRLSWLYPDDGCFFRAYFLANMLEKYKLPETKKLFVFGNLVVDTPNHPRGFVSWSYHIVVVGKLDTDIFVFDPAIEPEHPLKLEDWVAKISPDPEHLEFSLCDKDTFAPNFNCSNPVPVEEDDNFNWYLNDILDAEVTRMAILERPITQLTNRPPWRKLAQNYTQANAHAVGQVFMRSNPATEVNEYYQLTNFASGAESCDLPISQQDNYCWKYLGTDFDDNFVQKTHKLRKNGRISRKSGKIGNIFKNKNTNTGITEYFKLLQNRKKKVLPFPNNQLDNKHWEYIGEDYPKLYNLN